jgi:integrase/recombinase XerD
MHVREAADEYIASMKRLRPLTVAGYEQRLDVFCGWCEAQEPPIELEWVRAKVVDNFVAWLKTNRPGHKRDRNNEMSTYTLTGYVRVIKSFMKWCLDDEEYGELLKLKVVQAIRKPKIEQIIIDVFTKEQLDAMFEACKQNYNGHLQARDRAMLSLLIDTGIREAELCSLTIGNVHTDPKDAFIRVHGKYNKWREIGLGDRSRRDIKTYLRLYRAGAKSSEVVFLNRACTGGLLPGGLLQIIKKLGKRANIQGVRCSPHTFRHTFACSYLLSGGDIYTLSRLLGHENISTTQMYLKAINAKQARQSLQGKSVLDQLS